MKKITKKNIKNYEKLLIEFETIYYKLESFIFDWFSEITGEKEDIISFDVRNGKIRIEIWNDELIQILGVNELDENFYEFDLNFFNKVNQAYLKKTYNCSLKNERISQLEERYKSMKEDVDNTLKELNELKNEN